MARLQWNGQRSRLSIGLLLFMVVLSVGIPAVQAQTKAEAPEPARPGELAQEQLDQLQTDEMKRMLHSLDDEVGSLLPPMEPGYWLAVLTGDQPAPNWGRMLAGLIHLFFGEMVNQISLLARLMVLVILAAVLQAIQGSFERPAVERIAYAVVYLALAAVVLSSLRSGMEVATGVLDDLVGFMLASLPVMISLLAGVGAFTSAAMFHPLMTMSVNATAVIVRDWVFPLLVMSTLVQIVNHFSDAFSIERLGQLLRQVAVGILGFVLTAFLGIVVIQGVAGSVADGVALRSVKFLSGSFIPVVGGMLSDATELVFTSSLLVKNSLGVLGLIFILAVSALPVLQLASLLLTYRLAAAVLEPVDQSGITDLLDSVSHLFLVVTGATAAVVVMFFLTIAIIIGLGDMSVMLR